MIPPFHSVIYAFPRKTMEVPLRHHWDRRNRAGYVRDLYYTATMFCAIVCSSSRGICLLFCVLFCFFKEKGTREGILYCMYQEERKLEKNI